MNNLVNREEILKSTLSNGIRVISEKVENTSSFTLGIHFANGSRHENDFPNGVAHFMEHYAFRRSHKFNNKQIAKRFEILGAVTNAFTTKEQVSFYATALNVNFDKVLDLLIEIVLNPEFISEDIEKEKEIILDEIRSYEDDHEDMIFEYAAKLMYEDNKLANPIAGSIESVSKINKTQLKKYHIQNFTTDQMIVTFAGAYDHEDIIPKLDSIRSRKGKNLAFKTPKLVEPSKLVVKKNSSQSYLILSHFYPNNDLELRYRFAIINILLGDGLSSRLYQRLRESLGLAYNIYSGFTNHVDLTEIAIYSSFEPRRLNRVRSVILKELSKIMDKGFSEREIKIAKELLKTYSVMESESTLSKMNIMARQEIIYGKQDTTLDALKRIESISKKQIDSDIDKIIKLEKWFEVVIQPND